MNLKWMSLAATALMIAGIVWLLERQELFAYSVPVMAAQIAAFLLMIWARITFGRRSFHATANPTAGGLVTTGPYHWLRHPIYTAAMLFVWAGVLYYRTTPAIAAAGLVTIGAAARMFAEETYLRETYPEYQAYKSRTARMVPFLF
jgi:protein-S-isoprenylcysteine O-methyltransferase Ste14